jgi:hypothetical protein
MTNDHAYQKFSLSRTCTRNLVVASVGFVLIVGFASATEPELPVVLEKAMENSPGQTTYYIDPKAGSDRHVGTSAQQAWKSLARASNMVFAPGDRILLRAGVVHRGAFWPQGSGTEDKPIVIDRYGKGVPPVLDAGGWTTDTIRLHNQYHWTLRNLTVSNDSGNWSNKDRRLLRAIHITGQDVGDLHGLHLENLTIRRVNGQYRGLGSATNGGVICVVSGNAKRTRFVDLQIVGCTFETQSIDRYALVVTSSWGLKAPAQVVYRNNRLDHSGQSHLLIPPEQWSAPTVFYYDPESDSVFELPKDAPPLSPKTGRLGCEDIFSETASRLKQAWDFFEATRWQEGHWLFKWRADAQSYDLKASAEYALATYGLLRALGLAPPWPMDDDTVLDQWTREINAHLNPKTHLLQGALNQNATDLSNAEGWLSAGYDATLRCQVFASDRYQCPPGIRFKKDFMASEPEARQFLETRPWSTEPWGSGSNVTRALNSRIRILMSQGKTLREALNDPVVQFVREWLSQKLNAKAGYWGGEKADYHQRVNGVMKLMVSYAYWDWPIPAPERIVDFILTGASDSRGFAGTGCNLLDPMFCLAVIRRQLPDYRSAEIRRYTAVSFISLKNTWNPETNWFSNSDNDWNGMHNLGAVLFMAQLVLGHPYMKGSIPYNWRQAPMITRHPDGTIHVNQSPIYHAIGHPFMGGG